jgi:predicted transcriptional regulator
MYLGIQRARLEMAAQLYYSGKREFRNTHACGVFSSVYWFRERFRCNWQHVGIGLDVVRRDRHDIVMEILKSAKSGRIKTELMKDVNMSFTQAQQYLSMLMEKGLLQINENRRFTTTKKGLEFMEKCQGCFLSEWHEQKSGKSHMTVPRK